MHDLHSPFWLVWNDRGGAPTYKHDTEQSARNEAERLARINQGQSFHVLRVVGTAARNDIAWTQYHPDEVPF